MSLGAGQFAIGLTIAQAFHPGFNVSHDFLGDLGLGPMALPFNGSIALFGLALLAASPFLFRGVRGRGLAIAVALAGIHSRLLPGDRILLQAVGGGVSWCAIVAEHQ